MKIKSIAALILLPAFFLACTNANEKQAAEKRVEKPVSPIEGNWVLVSNEVYGKQIKPKRIPQQLKMFHDGFFSFIMYDSSGAFYYAGAGPYEINGDVYKETFTFSSDTSYNDSQDWQKWEMKDDTLIFYGFEKAVLSNGRDVTKEWGGKGKFVEKRIRIK